MKREFITGLLPDIDKGVLDQIMAEHGKDIEAQKQQITFLAVEDVLLLLPGLWYDDNADG